MPGSPPANAAILRLADAVVRLDERRVERDDGTAVALTEQEARLLAWLAAHPGDVVPRDVLAVSVLGYSPRARSRAVDHAIARLRAKIEADPSEPRSLLTVHGVGYRLALAAPAPVEHAPPEPRRLVRGGVTVDLDARRVHRDGGVLALTDAEAALLHALDAARGRVVGRDELARRVRGRGEGRALDHLVHRLRAKIEPEPDAPAWLITERGRGFRLAADPLDAEASDAGDASRATELALLREAIARSRLVAVAGAPGAGKSWLAARIGPHWTVRLYGLTTEDQLYDALAGALDVESSGSREAIARALAARGPTTLVLDDADAAGDALSVVSSWLAAAPEARFVVTARRAAARDVIEVGPLDPIAAGALWEAVCGERPDPAVLAAIVAALGGLPAAIEHAARRARWMSPAMILERLREGGVGVPAPLRAALDLAWERLDPGARDALARLTVFRGPFTADAAAAVAADPDGTRLDTLVDERLVVRADDPHRTGDVWLVLPPTVREYAAAHVPPDAADAHAAWFAGFGAEDALRALTRTGGARRLRRLAASMADLEAAARHASREGRPADAARACLAALEVWRSRGPAEPGVDRPADWIQGELPGALAGRIALGRARCAILARRMADADAILDAAPAENGDDWLRVRLADTRAVVAIGRFDFDAAVGHAAAADAARRAGDADALGLALTHLADARMRQFRFDEAIRHLEDAVAAFLAGESSSEGAAWTALGRALRRQGRLHEARAAQLAAIELYEAEGVEARVGRSRMYLAWVHADAGDYEAAMRELRLAAAIHAAAGRAHEEADALAGLAEAMSHLGLAAEARDTGQRAIVAAHRGGDPYTRIVTRVNVAQTLARIGDGAEARRLIAANLAESHPAAAEVRPSQACLLARLDLDEDRPAEALAHLEEAVARLRSTGPASHLVHACALTAEAHARLARTDVAATWLDEAEALLARLGPSPAGELAEDIARARRAF